MPSRLPSELRGRLGLIRLVVLDVDGVLTDGRLFYTAAAEAGKVFNVRDGLGMRLLLEAGVGLAVITGRRSEAVALRCRELGLAEERVIQGSRDKSADLERLEGEMGLGHRQVAAIGDDLPDLPMLCRVGFAACPADAAAEVVAACDYICRSPGGGGVVRELAELILKGQGRWGGLLERWLLPEETP